MEQDRSAYLFQRYASKTCTSAERQEFMDLVKQADDNDILNLILNNFWESSPEIILDDEKANPILDRVLASGSRKIKKKPVLSFQWISWAAAVFILGIMAVVLMNKTEKQTLMPVTKLAPIKNTETISISTQDFHQKITLPDGSTIILNNYSSISYPKKFTNRSVSLTGEGYFDVKHDDHKVFTVSTGTIKTIVLGTAFNISAYGHNQAVKITVTRGKVSVSDSNLNLGIITPNQQIAFNKNNKKSSLSNVVAKNTIQWQESDLFFDDTSMEEAALILAKKFNTQITFSNEQAKKCKFSATFLKGESLHEILTLICSFNHATYQQNAGGITINGEGCES